MNLQDRELYKTAIFRNEKLILQMLHKILQILYQSNSTMLYIFSAL